MTVRNSSRPIARVFRATAAPGCRDELLQRFHPSSAALFSLARVRQGRTPRRHAKQKQRRSDDEDNADDKYRRVGTVLKNFSGAMRAS